MRLPAELRSALERELEGVSFADLAQASGRMTEQYRAGKPPRLSTRVEQLAYAAVRMPATYAAVHAALSECHFKPESMLDLGAGPGTAIWAAHAVFGSLKSAHAVERNQSLTQLGERLGAPVPVKWTTEDLSQSPPLPVADLVVLSYAMNEVGARALLEQAWQSTGMALALIEPGTPAGFRLVRKARDWLIAQGGFVAAPCPHAEACPMKGDNWCHFAARVERSSLHRRMKGAELGHEDEKFSYVVVTREPVEAASGRIVRHPRHRAGYVELELCTGEGLEHRNVAKSAGALHRAARKARWGDVWTERPEQREPEGSLP